VLPDADRRLNGRSFSRPLRSKMAEVAHTITLQMSIGMIDLAEIPRVTSSYRGHWYANSPFIILLTAVCVVPTPRPRRWLAILR